MIFKLLKFKSFYAFKRILINRKDTAARRRHSQHQAKV